MQSSYWQRAFEIGGSVYRDAQPTNVDEQAGPAYFAGLSLSRWLFWQRLKWAARHIKGCSGERALDFGCGFGLLLPLLREQFKSTTAVDLMPTLATEFLAQWDQDTHATNDINIVASLEAAQLQPGSLDLIVALDVLEHFQSLTEIVSQLTELLCPTGRLLVSGPTESRLYRFGRSLVGFSGAYHHQTIYDVHAALKPSLAPVSICSLPPIAPLFLTSIWQKRS